VLLIWVAATVNERFLIRPEMASFPLLAAVQLVLADGRRNPKRLRWLVPLMIAWANMHALFILGVAAIAAAIGGAVVAESSVLPEAWRRDSAWPGESRRGLIRWGAAAIGATAFNPYLLRGLLFPIELITRINGSNVVYSTIGEFRRPFSGYFQTFGLGSYQAFIFALAGLAVLAGLMRAGASRPSRGEAAGPTGRFDIAACAFAAALAWLSLLARRNIGIFAIGAVPFMSACLGIVLGRAQAWKVATGTAMRFAVGIVLIAAAAVTTLAATNRWYAMTGETHEFGLGVFQSNFQPRATQFFREQKLPGPTFNDLGAGGYLTWDDPSGKGVYIDGRLEVYDTAFFSAYTNNLTNFEAWRKDADARGIQSVMLFHRWQNRHPLIRALGASGEWASVYYDETVVIFVRTAGHADVIDTSRNAFATTWRARTDAALTAPPQTFGWQWSLDRSIGQVGYGNALQVLGETREALKWFELALSGSLSPMDEVDARQHAAQCLALSGELAGARVHLVRALELDPASDVTREMLRRLDGLSR
jgi:tetratricopeptide (TPR) repeat protein